MAETPLREAAVAMHEMFNELITVGFTEQQALQIVIGMSRGSTNAH